MLCLLLFSCEEFLIGIFAECLSQGWGSLPRRVWRAPPIRRVIIVESLAGIALRTGGPAIRLKNKQKTDEAQKVETVLVQC